MNIWQLDWWLVACGTTLGCHETGLGYEMTATPPLQMPGCCSKNCDKRMTQADAKTGYVKEKVDLCPSLKKLLLNWLLDFLESREASQADCSRRRVAVPRTYVPLETAATRLYVQRIPSWGRAMEQLSLGHQSSA